MIDVIMPVWIINEELRVLTMQAIQSLGKVNLIIVDNGSPLGGGYLRSVADVYIRNKENLGYAKAVNQGLKLSKNEMKAISNNDTRISPNWQEVAKEVFEDDDVYSCHFRMIDYEAPFIYGDQIFIGGRERWCSSSFFVIKSWTPQLYDENYLNSYDDWDYHKRIRESGWKQAYTNKASYQHHHSFTQKLIPEREVNDLKNKEYFKKKFGIYAEEDFAKQFPDQMAENYQEGML